MPYHLAIPQWTRRDSNPRHLPCKGSALPAELLVHLLIEGDGFITLVGEGGFEPPATRVSGAGSYRTELLSAATILPLSPAGSWAPNLRSVGLYVGCYLNSSPITAAG